MYDFTACIVTYNTPASDLERIIKCFQKIKLNFKLWISDNSETDNLKFFFEKTDDARIEYIFNNSNKGFGAGHNVVINKLISNSKISEFHLIINADIYFEENIIEKIVEYNRFKYAEFQKTSSFGEHPYEDLDLTLTDYYWICSINNIISKNDFFNHMSILFSWSSLHG